MLSPWHLVELLLCLHVMFMCFFCRQYSRMCEKIGNFPMPMLQKTLEWVNSPGEKVWFEQK